LSGRERSSNKSHLRVLQMPDRRAFSKIMTEEDLPDYARQHADAVARGEDYYMDERSGLLVFTELYLNRRPCCQNACRHCPYGFTKQNYKP